MLTRRVLSVLLVLIFVQSGFAQQIPEKPKTVTDDLRKEAVEFLRETSAEVGNLRSLENRISFSSEMAGLMWYYDAKEAAAMYQTVITDFKQLLADYDAQMNLMKMNLSESDYRRSVLSGDQTDEARLSQKFYKALGVRQQIAMSLAEHDAALAYNFFYDTLGIITNADLRQSVAQRDTSFEMQLIKQIAIKDPAKAIDFGRKSISKGVGWMHVELLKDIYEKDNAKGAELADEIVKKFRDDKVSASNLYNLGSFLRLGAENSEKIKKEIGKKPMFSDQNMRALADVLAQSILETKTPEGSSYVDSLTINMDLIEKYAPARAAQIRAKFGDKTKPKPVPTPGIPDSKIIDVESTPTGMTDSDKIIKQYEEDRKNLSSKDFPKEEREKIVAQARKTINSMGSRREKIMALSELAALVVAAGDKELAAEVLKDAQTLVNPQPKNYQDFLEVWFLSSAYAMSDPDKAFPLLEDAVRRLNDTLAAFIKVGEFMDVSGEMIDDGEVQVGAFGGTMMTGITRELGIADSTLRELAIADFGKTKALTNQFDRTEVRILAKMLVLRAVLGDESKKTVTGATTGTEEY